MIEWHRTDGLLERFSIDTLTEDDEPCVVICEYEPPSHTGLFLHFDIGDEIYILEAMGPEGRDLVEKLPANIEDMIRQELKNETAYYARN